MTGQSLFLHMACHGHIRGMVNAMDTSNNGFLELLYVTKLRVADICVTMMTLPTIMTTKDDNEHEIEKPMKSPFFLLLG